MGCGWSMTDRCPLRLHFNDNVVEDRWKRPEKKIALDRLPLVQVSKLTEHIRAAIERTCEIRWRRLSGHFFQHLLHPRVFWSLVIVEPQLLNPMPRGSA